MGYFFGRIEGIFSAQEEKYIASFDSWAVEDRDAIRAFAEDVNQGVHEGSTWNKETSPGLEVVCYRDGRRMAQLDVHSRMVISGSGAIFRYPAKSLNTRILDPPGLQDLRLRFWCAMSLRRLHFDHVVRSQESTYPAPRRWCDAIVEHLQQRQTSRGGERVGQTYSDADIAALFRCPNESEHMDTSADEPIDEANHAERTGDVALSWVSDYAMNPNCEPNSPPDTVLLFEAKPGWNQQGGPELFTFDNHDPKGGCVLLNDGTIRFIRTEEELTELRWK
ncbi:hypothetical protein GF356_01570 [candidate division GN15 bacterium]|nr:hypothetical protein [candidate division GN15 bacterium]